MKQCQICQEETNNWNKHHIVPKSKGGTFDDTIICCRTCGKQVHMLFTNKELSEMSLEELLATEEMKKYAKWKHKHRGHFRGRPSSKVREWKKYHR